MFFVCLFVYSLFVLEETKLLTFVPDGDVTKMVLGAQREDEDEDPASLAPNATEESVPHARVRRAIFSKPPLDPQQSNAMDSAGADGRSDSQTNQDSGGVISRSPSGRATATAGGEAGRPSNTEVVTSSDKETTPTQTRKATGTPDRESITLSKEKSEPSNEEVSGKTDVSATLSKGATEKDENVGLLSEEATVDKANGDQSAGVPGDGDLGSADKGSQGAVKREGAEQTPTTVAHASGAVSREQRPARGLTGTPHQTKPVSVPSEQAEPATQQEVAVKAPGVVTGGAAKSAQSQETEKPKLTKPVFKLGAEGNYKLYVNQYFTTSLALNKYQHMEQRDRKRSVAKFCPLYDFKWTGEPFGNKDTILNALRCSIVALEGSIPTAFMHPAWPVQRSTWVRAVHSSATPCDFAASLNFLLDLIKPICFLPVWREAVGHLKFGRIPVENRGAPKKKEHKDDADDEEEEVRDIGEDAPRCLSMSWNSVTSYNQNIFVLPGIVVS